MLWNKIGFAISLEARYQVYINNVQKWRKKDRLGWVTFIGFRS